MRPRGLRVLAERRHRHQADDADRAALDERRRARRGRRPPLPSSPATLTSTRTSVSGVAVAAELLERRVGGDRVDQAAERQQLLHLAALQVADEVPLEGVAPALVLGREVLLAVLADQRRPRPRPARPSPPAARTWSRRGSRPPRRALAHPLEVGGDPGRVEAVDQPGHRSGPPPSSQASPAWRRPRAPRPAPARGRAISPSSLRRSASARPRPSAGPCGTPGRDQVVAVDLELDRAPLGQVAVEPLGAHRPGEDQLDRVVPARQLDRLRGRAGLAVGQLLLAAGRAERGGEHRVGRAATTSRQGGAASSSATRAASSTPPSRSSTSPHSASSSKPRAASGSAASRSSSASRRSAETVLEVGLAQQLRGLGLELEAEAGRVAGGAQRPGRVVVEGARVQDPQQARPRDRRDRRGGRSAAARRAAGSPSR